MNSKVVFIARLIRMPNIIVMIANSFLPSKKRNYANFMRLVAVRIIDAMNMRVPFNFSDLFLTT